MIGQLQTALLLRRTEGQFSTSATIQLTNGVAIHGIHAEVAYTLTKVNEDGSPALEIDLSTTVSTTLPHNGGTVDASYGLTITARPPIPSPPSPPLIPIPVVIVSALEELGKKLAALGELVTEVLQNPPPIEIEFGE